MITQCTTALIPKGAGASHLDLRPITLNSIIYSIWATTRCRQTSKWHEQICHASLYGARANLGTSDAEIPGALQLEIAACDNISFIGLAEDRTKCFDLFNADTVIPLLAALGLDDRLVRAISGFYRIHERRFRIRGTVSQPFLTKSLVQGDAWSTRIVNAAFTLLAVRARNICPMVTTQYFVDDSKVRTPLQHIEQLKTYVRASNMFNKLTGQEVNSKKCIAWGTTTAARKLSTQFVEDGGRVLVNFKSLGYCVTTSLRKSRSILKDRIKATTRSLQKVATLPHASKQRAHFACMCSLSKLTHGVEISMPSTTDLGALVDTVLRAIWSKDQMIRCSSLLFVHTFKAHELHPYYKCLWLALRELRKFLTKHEAERHLFNEYWDECVGNRPGPIHTLKTIFKHLQWNKAADWIITREDDVPVNMMQASSSLWSHEARRSIKYCLIRGIVTGRSKRKDLKGLRPIHPFTTPAQVLQGDSYKNVKSGNMQGIEIASGIKIGFVPATDIAVILSGSLRTADRLYPAKLINSPNCPFGCNCKEDPEHFWVHCPHNQHINNQYKDIKDAPVYTSCLGLIAEPEVLKKRRQYLISVKPPDDPDNNFFELAPNRVWTDGACKNQDNADIRMAGSGIFFGFGHPCNKAWPIAGLEQTSIIAEMEAVLYILYWVTWPITIYTDNQFTVDCVNHFCIDPHGKNHIRTKISVLISCNNAFKINQGAFKSAKSKGMKSLILLQTDRGLVHKITA